MMEKLAQAGEFEENAYTVTIGQMRQDD